MALTFANKITICRILLVPFFIATVLSYNPADDFLRFVALAIFMFAVVSDVIDGYIARTRHQKTKAGKILDPLADKILLISAFICLYKIGILLEGVRFPVWLVVAVISRDLILLLGVTIIYLLRGEAALQPTFWGKATTFFQVLSIIGILLQWPLFSLAWYPMLVFTVISTIDYTRKGIKVINNQEETR